MQQMYVLVRFLIKKRRVIVFFPDNLRIQITGVSFLHCLSFALNYTFLQLPQVGQQRACYLNCFL